MEDKYKVEISEIRITSVHSDNGLVAIASCVIDGKFFVGSIGVYSQNGQYRLTYPTKKRGINAMSTFHPIKRPVADQIREAIVEEYKELLTSDITEDDASE